MRIGFRHGCELTCDGRMMLPYLHFCLYNLRSIIDRMAKHFECRLLSIRGYSIRFETSLPLAFTIPGSSRIAISIIHHTESAGIAHSIARTHNINSSHNLFDCVAMDRSQSNFA